MVKIWAMKSQDPVEDGQPGGCSKLSEDVATFFRNVEGIVAISCSRFGIESSRDGDLHARTVPNIPATMQERQQYLVTEIP